MVAKVLVKTGSLIKSWAMMYNAVSREVLLYGSEIWVVTDEIMTVLEVFHHMIYRWIMGMKSRKGDSGEW